ncbi:hypothetical protein [Nitratireductor soli]|uniref:hypothetical protein n=1 Tax=Nitratireductor soli TaxID=1670619 RepID=UPI000AD010BD|nr:hypothetical protein [Nitratireductor soli]
MKRYFYEPGHPAHTDWFCVFDRRRSAADGAEIARCKSRDDAEKIVSALNFLFDEND